MNENKKEIMKKMQQIRERAQEQVEKEGEQSQNTVVQNVRYYGKVVLMKKEDQKPVEFDLYTVEEYDFSTDKTSQRIYLNGQGANIEELIQTYEDPTPIQDTLQNAKAEQEKGAIQKNTKVYDLNEMEMELYASIARIDKNDVKRVAEIKDNNQEKRSEVGKQEESKVASITPLQEMEGNTPVNNYQTLEQALGLKNIQKFVVVYSETASKIGAEDTENQNKSPFTYSMLAIQNDGAVINLQEKLLPVNYHNTDTAGRIQTDGDGTTQKEHQVASMYTIQGTEHVVSFEKGNSGEIQVYYGALTKGIGENEANIFTGTQLETHTVWPTSKDVRAQEDTNKGNAHPDRKVAEANPQLQPGNSIPLANADGDLATVKVNESDLIPGTQTTWRDFANLLGYRSTDGIQRAYQHFQECKKENPQMSPQEIIEYLPEEITNETPARNEPRL